jgi:anti-sigma factor RsiW
MTCDLNPDKLDAYVDESLPPEELATIESHMRNCASCAAEALARLQMKRAIRAAAANLALSHEFSMRPEFRLKFEKSIQKTRRPPWENARLQWLAATAVALLLLAVSATMFMRHAARNQALAELLDLHVATIASTNPVDVVSTDRHTVKPWFQGKLPFTFNLPELQDSPYKLLGGKLVYFQHNPGAQLLFELHKHELSVFIVQDSPDGIPIESAVSSRSEKGFSVETWSQSGLRYVVISDAGPADVNALGDLLRSAGRL